MNDHPLHDLAPRLVRDRVSLGIFLVTGNSMLAEASSLLDFDWAVIDMEAAPVSRVEAFHSLQVLSGSGLMPLVRVPSIDRNLIEHALDAGAHGVVVPRVEQPDQAREAVEACRYPPIGQRGVNPIRSSGYFTNLGPYFAGANERTVCVVQIETETGVAQADEIAAVDGVDVVFVGVGDLASSLGVPGRPDDPTVLAACSRILEATRAAGKVPGIFAYSAELGRHHAAEGFRMIAIGNEVKFFMTAATDALGALRQGS